MQSFITLSNLNDQQKAKYKTAMSHAFPKIILKSEVIKIYWDRLETYFPDNQIFLLNHNHEIIGFMNMVPFQWDQPLNDLPETGWDWMLQKGIEDYENNIKPNCLGGLQIIIPREYQGLGLSKTIIAEGKKTVISLGFKHLLIPIRPTLKHKHPEMSMMDYMQLRKSDDKIYDPWIRAHLNGGAEIIKICSNSMNIKGDIPFWEGLHHEKINRSAFYHIEGALNMVDINVEENAGEYREENIWICYG